MIDIRKTRARWTVTLDRADKANALTLDMLTTLADAFEAARREPDLRLLVITGAGDRVFSAGADLGQARDGAAMTTSPYWGRMSRALATLPCLTIAALNGTLAGGSFGLAVQADLRIAVPHAKFFYPVLKNGFLPQPVDVDRMRALIGPARTKLILLGGQKLDAEEALAIGLIDRIVASGEIEPTIAALAETALTAEQAVLTAIKRICGQSLDRDMLSDCYRAVYDGDAEALQRLRAEQS